MTLFRARALAIVGCLLTLAAGARPSVRHALAGHIPAASKRLKPLGALSATNQLRLALGLPLRDPAGLTAFLHDLYAPSSQQFHKFLKPSEFTQRFGPTEEDYAAVSAFALAHGLRVVDTHANRLLLDVEGSVAEIQKAFGVRLNLFQHPKESRNFYAPDAEPTVEAGLRLQHVSGLDNFDLPKPNVVRHSGKSPASFSTGSGPSGLFWGRDFRAAYAPGVTLDGAGQSVALVEFDTFYTNDIATYEDDNSLPHVPLVTIPLDGFHGPPGNGEPEVALDIEMSVAMAPGLAQVLIYQAPYESTAVTDDLLNHIATDDSANQIACCWIFGIDATTDVIFQEMAAQGQSFFTASGDFGAWDVDMPQLLGDPNITIVGGTTLTTSSAGGPWASETIWNGFNTHEYFPGAGGSGGISANYPIPAWQQAVNMSSNQGSTVWRNTPDVALVGDGIWVAAGNGGSENVGGTSCATPLWAAFTALINQQGAQYGRPPVGFLNPAIYGLAQSPLYPSLFHDIVTGNNTNANSLTEFFATTGYDLCTGWGTPAGPALINALAPPDSLVLEPIGGLFFAVTNGVGLSGESQTLILTNTENTTVDWAVGAAPDWLGVSANRGALTAGIESVDISINGSATNLPPGGYLADLIVTDVAPGVAHLFPVFLQVSDPLIVTPASGFAVAGPVGGPFSPDSQIYTLSNASPSPINWTAQSTSAFAIFAFTNGTLPGGGTTNLTATLSSTANNLLLSAPFGKLLFTDLNTTNSQTEPFTLSVGNGDFETGDFSDWTFVGNPQVNEVVGVLGLGQNYIHAGEYAALLGEPQDTASLAQTLPTPPGQPYLISLYLDNPVGGPTNQFIVKWSGATLFNQLNVPQISWTNLQFAVTATNASTSLEFDFRNDPDAFGLDDITVTPIAPPNFTSVATSNSAIVFNWNAVPGFAYRLQYATNLASPSWVFSGATIKATNSVAGTLDTQHTDAQRFYRILVVSP